MLCQEAAVNPRFKLTYPSCLIHIAMTDANTFIQKLKRHSLAQKQDTYFYRQEIEQ